MPELQLTPCTPVIVTGAASGIGFAAAEALAQVGRSIALWDIDTDRVAAAASQICERYRVKAVGLVVDVSDLAAIERGVADSRAELGVIGGLVHAAGIDGVGAIAELSAEQWSKTLDINLRAEVFLTQAVLEDLKASDGAAIVGVASINGTLGNAANPSYSASKAGLLGVSRALADDLGHHGIRINCISPGQIDTPMLQRSMDAVPGLRDAFVRRILMGRLGQPSEIGKAVRFLMSDEASYVTGAELIVDGGNVSSQRA